MSSYGSAITSPLSAYGALKGGYDKASTDTYNSTVALNNAQIATQQAQEKSRRITQNATMVLGAGRAAYGASGVTSDGSAADVLAAGAKKATIDAITAEQAGSIRATAYQNASAQDLWEASNDKTNAWLGAASTMLSAGSNAYGSSIGSTGGGSGSGGSAEGAVQDDDFSDMGDTGADGAEAAAL